MSRYRNIHCLIWNDDKFPFVSDDCQLLFFHLLTTPFSTPFGLYKISLNGLADEKRWNIERYREAFNEALLNGFVKYDKKHLVIFIPKFLKYNPPANPNVLTNWRKILDEIPNSQLKNEWFDTLKDLLKGYGKGFQKELGKEFLKGMAIQEQEQEQEQNKKEPTPDKSGGTLYNNHWINVFSGDLVEMKRLRDELVPYNNCNYDAFIQQKLNISGHPKAIIDSFKGLLKRMENDQAPKNAWAYMEKIFSVENGNYNERDSVRLHEEIKNLKIIDYDIQKICERIGN